MPYSLRSRDIRFFFFVFSLAFLLVTLQAEGGKPAAPNPRLEQFLHFAKSARELLIKPEVCLFSVPGTVMRLGSNPDTLAKFVREKIAWEPYQGVARGPEGTLAAMSGSDWDRAGLLAALLNEAGYKTQFRVSDRTEKEAQAIIDWFLKKPATLAAYALDHDFDEAKLPAPAKLCEQFGVNPGNRVVHLRETINRWRHLLDEAFDGGGEEYPDLAALLNSAEVKTGQTFADWQSLLTNAARQDVDVLITVGDNNRLYSVNPVPGVTPKLPKDSENLLDEIPENSRAFFSLRVVMKTGEQGNDDPVTLIECRESLGNLWQQPIQVQIVPSDSKAAGVPTANWSPQQWFAFVSGFQKFQVAMRVGETFNTSKAFDLNGSVYNVSDDGRIEGAKEMGGAVGGMMGGFFGGGGPSQEPKESPKGKGLDSLILELELTLPGQEPRIQKRIIYGALRKDVTPVYSANILVAGGPIRPANITWMAIDALTQNAPAFANILSSEDPRRFENTDGMRRMPTALYEWLLGRIALAGRLLEQTPGLDALEGPMVIMQTVHLTLATATKEVNTLVAMDVAFDHQMLFPRSAEACVDAVKSNIILGVGSTILESGILGKRLPDARRSGPFGQWAQARLAGQKPVVLKTPGAPGSPEIQPAPLSAWAIAVQEKEGVLLLPMGQGAHNWWSIHPGTGLTIGRADGGEGQAMVEYNKCVKASMDNLKCMLGAMKGGLSGENKNSTAKGWMACITAADNPGSYVGGAGGVMDVVGQGGSVSEVGSLLSVAGDVLGGLYDIYGMVSGD